MQDHSISDFQIIIIYDNNMKQTSISAILRRMRLKRKFSLAEAAQRAGTSAPTFCRYESQYRRFEIQTLEKLASALDCRLIVEFEPLEDVWTSPDGKQVRKRLSRLFWDHPLRLDDLHQRLPYVMKRALEYGNLDDVQGLVSVLGRRKFLEEVSRVRFNSKRTATFWAAMMKKEGIQCTRISSPKKAKTFWPH